jgi:hypothetical protein
MDVYSDIKANIGRYKTLTVASRFTGIPVGTLSDIVRGKASKRKLRLARRRLRGVPIQDTPTSILAWQIKNRVEV